MQTYPRTIQTKSIFCSLTIYVKSGKKKSSKKKSSKKNPHLSSPVLPILAKVSVKIKSIPNSSPF